jgi:hypothetical protein
MLRVSSACGRSSGQWLIGKAGWVLDKTLTKCRLKVWMAFSAVLVRLLSGGTRWYAMVWEAKKSRSAWTFHYRGFVRETERTDK